VVVVGVVVVVVGVVVVVSTVVVVVVATANGKRSKHIIDIFTIV